MSEDSEDVPWQPTGLRLLEERSRAVFQESVEGVDFALRSRLTQARHAALAAAAQSATRPWLSRLSWGKPAAGLAMALLLGVALWLGNPAHLGAGGDAGSVDDLDIVAASDGGSVDALDMLQDDLDFYDFADKLATTEPAA